MKTASRPVPAVAAAQWHDQLAEPFRRGPLDALGQVAVVRYRNIDHRLDQPPLLENLLSIHLGGAKRVTRWCGRHHSVHDVALKSLTIMPARHSCRWSTEGPIDFAHIVFGHGLLSQVAIEEHDRYPFDLALRDGVGIVDKTVRTLFSALLDDLDRPEAGQLYRESLLTVLSYHLVRDYSTLSLSNRQGLTGRSRISPSRGGMSGWQLRRVVEFMHGHMVEDIRLIDLVALTGLSRAQFFRAFTVSTGFSPFAFLTELRLQSVLQLLKSTNLALSAVAAGVGLTQAQLYSLFRRRMGMSPSAYRQSLGGRSEERLHAKARLKQEF